MNNYIIGRRKRKNFEMRFYEGLLEGNPDFIQALSCLGDVYTERGFFSEGLAIDRKLVFLRPEDPIVRYNLACSFSLIGDLDQSLKELKKAILLGYDDFSYILEDQDLDNLRNDRRFPDFLVQLKRIKKLLKTDN
ncbi:MAG: hypothetical protein PHV17_05875 [Candidatus Omnitrophica bacterium]|nr:hypothetical protein [Candidatus Omnitrophota bacterium]